MVLIEWMNDFLKIS